MTGVASEERPKQLCLCEARIAPAILDGYACGNPDCWRTAAAEASFADFVAKLVAARDRGGESELDRP